LIQVAILPSPALAHNSGYWFDPVSWDSPGDIDYKIDDSIPGPDGSAFEDRIQSSIGRWKNQSCIGSIAFVDAGNGNHAWGPSCDWEAATTDISIFYHDIAGTGTGGTEMACVIFHPQQGISFIHSDRIAFGVDPTWYTGTEDPPNGELSVSWVAAHELGHATGVFRGGNASEGNSGGHWVPEPSPMMSEWRRRIRLDHVSARYARGEVGNPPEHPRHRHVPRLLLSPPTPRPRPEHGQRQENGATCSEALKIARTSRGILGANGITLENPIMRHTTNLESVLTYEGTEEVHTLVIGEQLTGLKAFT
jgi:hypothetical protein